jgi:hypothetical protein
MNLSKEKEQWIINSGFSPLEYIMHGGIFEGLD